jgi:hypothetical protein
MWPVYLEWGSTGWYRNAEVSDLVNNDVVKEMVEREAYVFDSDRLTRVFKGVEPSKFSDIAHAIEARISSYDDETEDDEDVQLEIAVLQALTLPI